MVAISLQTKPGFFSELGAAIQYSYSGYVAKLPDQEALIDGNYYSGDFKDNISIQYFGVGLGFRDLIMNNQFLLYANFTVGGLFYNDNIIFHASNSSV